MSADVVGKAYSLLSRRSSDWSLDQSFYVDQAFFDLEMQLYFGRQWLFAALACEIPLREGVDYDIGRLTKVWAATNDQALKSASASRARRRCLQRPVGH